ncbi:MAG: nonstructural protein [Microviridae sp.]|nr:MAG: nonstructural protein [Microviridae sp.]
MRLHVYAVLDQGVGAFLPPLFMRSKGEALRSFTEAVNDPKSNFHRYAHDFHLMYLGEWDDNSGAFDASVPVRIISGNEVLISDVFPPEKKVS